MRSLTKDPMRWVLFAALLLLFAVAGGFERPSRSPGSTLKPIDIYRVDDRVNREIAKTWIGCMALYIAGAVCATVVDDRLGYVEPMSFRAFWVIPGVLAMGVALAWHWMFRAALAG
ncbi:hypothetical protein BH11VER1_BH11VER1_05150 [soil metagenome]